VTGRSARGRRSGAFEAWIAIAALLSYLLGAKGWLMIAGLTAVAALDLSLAVVIRTRRRHRLRTLQGFLSLSPRAFEVAVAGLPRGLGDQRVKVVGGAGDLGADIVCADPAGDRVVVQCKRYAPGHHVGSPAVQAFIGMAFIHHKAGRAIFVTTSSFTPSACRLARAHPVELIDGSRLVELACGRHAKLRPLGRTPPGAGEVPAL